ncbi:MAG: hypothetical protein M1817_002020 [Caeruleum heppii]|nr:MAG: hypothetical protein M1817_002020 [Caeruleum heppii]
MTLPPAPSLPALLTTLTTALTSSGASLPETPTALLPQPDDISLLTTKNELLLAYLHQLVFWILGGVRRCRPSAVSLEEGDEEERVKKKKEDDEEEREMEKKTVEKLIELRVYLEKGVRPLEGRLRYQLDKVVRVAEEVDEEKKIHKGGERKNGDDDGEASDSDNDSDDDDEDNNTTSQPPQEINELSYRPNPSSLLHKSSTSTPTPTPRNAPPTSHNTQPYRPPRITPTTLPPPPHYSHQKPSHRPAPRSATLSEYLTTEHSTAPIPEPSIGSTILSGGRRSKSERDRAVDGERRAYEESNFVRLPKEGRKERSRGKRQQENGYGGEEWRGLGEVGERIGGLVGGQRKMGGVLERSRKREYGGGEKGGVGIGERFEKRRKMMEQGRGRRGGG